MKHAALLQTLTIDNRTSQRSNLIELTDEPALATRRGIPTLFTGLLLIIAMLVGLATAGHAQCAVANPSFEEVNVSALPSPGWGASPSSETPIPGLPGWYTRERSPDIFWPSSHVPNNFMTASPLFAFHGKNYAGISAGRFSAGYLKEVLAGTLNFSPVGAAYEVRARFAMGTVRNNPIHVQVYLDGPSGQYWVGHTVVNSPNWTLFSRIINIPSGTYDRIVIAGVDSMPRYLGGYAYIDSVDICRADVCDYLSAGIKFNSSANGKCCFDLYVNNSVPAALQPAFGVRVRPDAPAQIVSATSNAGWVHNPNFPTHVTWRDAAGLVPLPLGSNLFAGTYCIQPNGAMPQVHVIEFLDRQGNVICRDTAYSECESKIPDCFRFLETKVDCGPVSADGSQGYNVSFIAVNNSGIPGTLTFTSPYGTVSPSSFVVGPGNTPISLVFTDMPPVNNPVCLYATLTVQQNGQISVICRDSICFDLPPCHEGCCDRFLKRIEAGVKYVNGTVGINGCALAGPSQIKRFSATIVAASTRRVCGNSAGPWTPVFGDVTNAALGTTLPGPYFITNPPYSREVVWGGPSNPNCVSFNPCVPFKLKLSFPNPPLPFHGCRDTLRFCIRYSFTDCECRTCDTVICYSIVRKYTPVPWDGGLGHGELGGGRTKEDDGSVRQSAGAGENLLKLTMTSADNGTLRVTFPAGDPTAPPIRIVGMTFRPQEVALVSLVERSSGKSASIVGNSADIALDFGAGSVADFDVTYSNSDGLTAIGNSVRFRFVSVDDPSDTLESDNVTVFGFTPGTFTGDSLTELTDRPELGQVKTYALHLSSSNNANKGIASFRITPRNGATLIAVGPLGDGTSARLAAGSDENGESVVQLAEGTWQTGDPIHGVDVKLGYVTIAGVQNGRTVIDFTTYAEDGSTMTEGTLELVSSLATVEEGDESGEAAGSFHLAVSPNPTSDMATAQIGLRSSAMVTLSIRDLRGAEVARPIDRRSLEAGEHVYAVQLDELAQGNYLMVLDVNGRVQTKTLQIVR